MTWLALQLLAGGLACVALFWALPRGIAQAGVAAATLTMLTLLSPATAIYMLASVAVTHAAMTWFVRQEVAALVASIGLGTAFLLARDLPDQIGVSLSLIGVAYFTLRHIHVLMEWGWGRLPAPSIASLLQYNLLLPVLMSGPIHRLPHFQRECRRRRWTAEEFFTGAERALFGVAMVVILGDFVFGVWLRPMFASAEVAGRLGVWLVSAGDWIRLYVYFSGYTDLALGLCLMMGLRLEENFNQPWRARSLIEFWTRWHMTLSHWCRDYVYVPVAAVLRSPVVGVAAALLVLGIWHQTSVYYVAWALWQTAGIVLTHLYGRLGDPLRVKKWPRAVVAVAAPFAILAWLSGARPAIDLLLGVSPS